MQEECLMCGRGGGLHGTSAAQHQDTHSLFKLQFKPIFPNGMATFCFMTNPTLPGGPWA